MGSFSIWPWLIVLVVVLVIFGPKRLRGAGRDLGEAVKGFKKGMHDDDKPTGQLGDQSRSDETSDKNAADSQRNDDSVPR